MKIVAKRTVKMQVDSYVDDLVRNDVDICRIELSAEEFSNLWKACSGLAGVDDYNINWRSVGFCKLSETGSYFIYRNICVQHHKDYPYGDLGVEYI